MPPFPRGPVSQLVGGWLYWLSQSEQKFIHTERATDSGYGFIFSALKASASIALCELTEILIHHDGILRCMESDQGTHFTAKEVQRWAYAHEINWIYHIPHNLVGLIEDGMAYWRLSYATWWDTTVKRGSLFHRAQYRLWITDHDMALLPFWPGSIDLRIRSGSERGFSHHYI